MYCPVLYVVWFWFASGSWDRWTFQVFAKPIRGGNFCIPCSLSLSIPNRQEFKKNNSFKNFSLSLWQWYHTRQFTMEIMCAHCTFCQTVCPQNKCVTNSFPAIPKVKTVGFGGVSPNTEKGKICSSLATKPRSCKNARVQLHSNTTRSLGWVGMASFLPPGQPGGTTGLALCCTSLGTGTQCQIFTVCVSQALILLTSLKGLSCCLPLKPFLLVQIINEMGCPCTVNGISPWPLASV